VKHKTATGKHRLTTRQRVFVAHFLKCLNATQAAKECGVSETSASAQGSKWLSIPKVAQAVDRGLRSIERAEGLNAASLSRIVDLWITTDPLDFVYYDEEGQESFRPLRELTREQRLCIQEITKYTTGGKGDGQRLQVLKTTLKFKPGVPSAELAGKFRGMTVNRTERYSEEHILIEVTERMRAALARGRPTAVEAQVIGSLPAAPSRSAEEIRADLAQATEANGEPDKGQKSGGQ